ncbi:MAG: response regulator, partial [Deltaproteobacteria bacterium]
RQLLTFSRRVESKKQPLDLNHEVKRVRELLERTMPKMVEIELRLSQDLRTINADPAQIEQMLMNLAVNAEDAMAEGGKLIIETDNATLDEDFCSRHVDAKVGDYGVISLTDTGPGLDDETLERIFEPFFSSKPFGDRPGLGLSMVYGIVKNHEGYIVCDSELGAGTTFKIYLPATVQERSVTEVSDVQVPVRGGVETILLVDDEPYLRDLGKQMLESYGYTVFIATDGESALEICRDSAKQIDLVILDLIMPGMGGGRCLQELVKENSPVKVVIASGFSPYDHTREALAGGAKSFIKKPYDMQQMLNVVRETLDED